MPIAWPPIRFSAAASMALPVIEKRNQAHRLRPAARTQRRLRAHRVETDLRQTVDLEAGRTLYATRVGAEPHRMHAGDHQRHREYRMNCICCGASTNRLPIESLEQVSRTRTAATQRSEPRPTRGAGQAHVP